MSRSHQNLNKRVASVTAEDAKRRLGERMLERTPDGEVVLANKPVCVEFLAKYGRPHERMAAKRMLRKGKR